MMSCCSNEKGVTARPTLDRLIAELECSELERGRLWERSCAVLYQHGKRIKTPKFQLLVRRQGEGMTKMGTFSRGGAKR